MSLKILCVVDKEGTALDRLAKGVTKYHDNLDYKVLSVHPKRPDPQQLAAFEREAQDADIIDWQYYRTAELLRGIYPWLKDKKQILTHNNPYSIEEQEWNDYDINVGNNEYITERLSQITDKPIEYIPLTADTDFWTFNPDWKFNEKVNSNNGYEFQEEALKPSVLMVANRIESKKGILPVAIACAEIGVHFILVGNISDENYFQAIMATGQVEFHENISDEALRDIYYRSTIHVCNSKDNFESGTLPILEAMLCGVPVLTRNVGHVPELNNGENMILLEGEPENVLGIQDKLTSMLADKKGLLELRDKAWQTAKNRSFERRAYMYQKLYRKVLFPDSVPVSVVVPIYDKPEIIRACLDAIAKQTHKNIEIIVADDNPEFNDSEKQNYMNGTLTDEFAKYVSIPVRYINTGDYSILSNYGLARARNEATIEATGEIIVYCDQRMIMQPDCIEHFISHLPADKCWLYGNKGGKKEFVENLSCIRRKDVIEFGLFNERIYLYGGLSQETRSRFRAQGGRTEYIESAKATPMGKSSNKNRKRADIIKMKNRLFKMDLQ